MGKQSLVEVVLCGDKSDHLRIDGHDIPTRAFEIKCEVMGPPEIKVSVFANHLQTVLRDAKLCLVALDPVTNTEQVFRDVHFAHEGWESGR